MNHRGDDGYMSQLVTGKSVGEMFHVGFAEVGTSKTQWKKWQPPVLK